MSAGKDDLTVRVFNEWRRLEVEEPETFERHWQSVCRSRDELRDESELSYGFSCAPFMRKLRRDLLIKDFDAEGVAEPTDEQLEARAVAETGALV